MSLEIGMSKNVVSTGGMCLLLVVLGSVEWDGGGLGVRFLGSDGEGGTADRDETK